MEIEGRKRSDNFEDRGRGGGGGGVPIRALLSVFRLLGLKGTLAKRRRGVLGHIDRSFSSRAEPNRAEEWLKNHKRSML